MSGREKSCCFTGHRPEKLPWGVNESDPRCVALKRKIFDAVSGAYEEGMRHFICGMARGCDFYFAEAVLELKKAHSDVMLEAAIPCPQQAERWSRDNQERWRRLVAAADLETVVQSMYSPWCMMRRNQYMVDHSSLVIAIYDGSNGGTRRTLEYALKQGVSFVDLAPESE